MKVFFDIETIPVQNEELINQIAIDIKPPATIKKAETLAKWESEEKQSAIEDAIAKTSFDGAYGQICCIGWAIDDQEPCSSIGTEKMIISTFFSHLNSSFDPSTMRNPVFIGHNVSQFDLRFLFQRAVINGIKPPKFIPFHAKSWDDTIFDTMTYFAGYGNRISLDKLCKALGIEGKKGITGADVWPMFKEGKINEIAEYCRHDVEITRQVYERLTFSWRVI